MQHSHTIRQIAHLPQLIRQVHSGIVRQLEPDHSNAIPHSLIARERHTVKAIAHRVLGDSCVVA